MINKLPIKTRNKLAKSAASLININTLIIDTETTGLAEDSEIVEIAILSISGTVLLNTLIKPIKPIDPKATAIHGITDEMVKDAPYFSDIAAVLYHIIKNKTLVGHNVAFDVARLKFELSRCGYKDFGFTGTGCTMLLCMISPNERWKRLAVAMKWLGVEYNGTAHRALYDAECSRLILFALSRLNKNPVEYMIVDKYKRFKYLLKKINTYKTPCN